ncbi:MAG: hypothetical protein WCJ19_03635 [bacterium]
MKDKFLKKLEEADESENNSVLGNFRKNIQSITLGKTEPDKDKSSDKVSFSKNENSINKNKPLINQPSLTLDENDSVLGGFRKKIKQISSGDSSATVTDLLNEIVKFGYEQKASDIHIEPREQSIMIRFRMD